MESRREGFVFEEEEEQLLLHLLLLLEAARLSELFQGVRVGPPVKSTERVSLSLSFSG
jgi:hypothetical protein